MKLIYRIRIETRINEIKKLNNFRMYVENN